MRPNGGRGREEVDLGEGAALPPTPSRGLNSLCTLSK